MHLQPATKPVCILQKSEQCINDFDCPLYTLTNEIYIMPVSSLIKPVSIIHSCTELCKFTDNLSFVHKEREQVARNELLFLHDFSNNTFSYNIFCASNAF